jgi:hypothetical protein
LFIGLRREANRLPELVMLEFVFIRWKDFPCISGRGQGRVSASLKSSPHVIEPFAGVDTNFSVPDRVKPGLVVQGFCASLPQLLLISSSAFLQIEKERIYLN